jgi:hypothetical protein
MCVLRRLAYARVRCFDARTSNAALFEYYHEKRRDTPCPPRPPWKRAEEGPPPLRDDEIPEGDLWGAQSKAHPAACIPV